MFLSLSIHTVFTTDMDMSVFEDISSNSHRNIQLLFEKHSKQQHKKVKEEKKRLESPSTPAGAHLRKLGIRLNSATALERRRLPTATECWTGGAVITASNDLDSQFRSGLSSAPSSQQTEMEDTASTQPVSKRVKRSLAVYSPQSQRVDGSHSAAPALLPKRSGYKPHRIDRRFYVAGANCHIMNRYQVDQEQSQSLANFLNKRDHERSKSKKLGLDFFKKEQTATD